jgi:hypothetical protein
MAVKRAQLRGDAWSTAGKRVEKHLMLTLCHLYNVAPSHYELSGVSEANREIDFYLIGNLPDQRYRCEVKLMGRGNPESADAVIARNSQVFVADKLSNLNKQQLTALGIEWVELHGQEGYRKFLTVLRNLGIPCQDFEGDVNQKLSPIFESLFPPDPSP